MPKFLLFQFDMPTETRPPKQSDMDIWLEAATSNILRAIEAGFYREIAEVEAERIDDVFRITNSIDEDWTRGEHVTMKVAQARSTMMGDVVLDTATGELLACASFGWQPLTPEENDAFRRALGLVPAG